MKRIFKFQILSLVILGGFFIFTAPLEAASLGEQINFYVDLTYDVAGRNQLSATLQTVGQNIYFYVENDYWNGLNGLEKSSLRNILEDLANEFDQVIYPKERAVFGSEWNPGIDNDKRITVLATQLIKDAGGYINIHNEYPRSQFSDSNEREMIYLNTSSITDSRNKAFLAHEFQHLITFYQKTLLNGLEEEVWLNEARSEYAPTLCGYNEKYNGSYLADRVGTFLDSPSDSLTEWKNNLADYGIVNLFFHYLVDHYGTDVITRMMLNNQVGITSINQALSTLGYQESFSDVFASWAVANYLNDCQIAPQNKYCYLNKNLTYPRLHVDYSASYSGFPNLIVSRSSSIKDWSSQWYRFRQGGTMATDRDTLKLDFASLGDKADFRVPYIVTDQSGQTTVQFIPLENQEGTAYISNFTSLNKSVIMIPFNQYKQSGFGYDESSTAFTFTASSVATTPLIINQLSPGSGLTDGGFQITIQGENLSTVVQIVFGQITITDFKIVNDQMITFTAPAQSAGSIDILLTSSDGQEATLANAFTYSGNPQSNYPDGSLLRAVGDYKVYIIKGNYKRWIQKAEIFNQYAHLRWEDIIEVTPQQMAQYQEAWLIRADGDPRVYELNADGTKHWLNMTAEQFNISGRLWNMVYIVNSFERDSYATGSDILFQ